MKEIRKLAVLSTLLLAAPAFGVAFETQQASSGPLLVSITCQTTDFRGVATSYIRWAVTITNFSSNDPTQLWWGVWENDGLFDDLICDETIDPSTSDPEYDPSTDTWSKALYLFCDISFYEPGFAQAQVYAWAGMTSPNYTAETPLIYVDLVTDNIAPETSITWPAAGTYGQDIMFEFAATDNYTQAGEFGFAWKLDPLEASYSAWNFADSKSYTGLPAGYYTFYVKAKDLATNEDTSAAMVGIMVETVSAPDAPSGPSTAGVGQEVTFTASGALSSEGHVLQYRFHFGDGTVTAWSSLNSASHTYYLAGGFQVKAQARCPAHSTESGWSTPSGINVTAPPPAPGDDGGGCSPLRPGRSAAAFAWLLPLALAAFALRRRRAAG